MIDATWKSWRPTDLACRQVGLRIADFGRMVAAAPAVGIVPAVASACTFGLDELVRARDGDHLRRMFAPRGIRVGEAPA
jgi:hypothetical protein